MSRGELVALLCWLAAFLVASDDTVLTAAQAHTSSSPSTGCSSALDCELLGRCSDDGSCICKPGWRGPTCGTLDLLPASKSGIWPLNRVVPPHGATTSASSVSVSESNETPDKPTANSWGASIVHEEETGDYHMYVTTGCYDPMRIMHIDGYQISHAVAKQYEGPYTWHDVVLDGPTRYNPHIKRMPDGKYVLYHCGAPSPSSGLSCTGTENMVSEKSSLSWWFRSEGFARDAAVAGGGDGGGGGGSSRLQSHHESKDEDTCNSGDCWSVACGNEGSCEKAGCVWYNDYCSPGPPHWPGIMIAHSSTPYGPWTSFPVEIQGGGGGGQESNASPLVFDDGSVLLAYRYQSPGDPNEYIGVCFAPSWEGPYVKIGEPGVSILPDQMAEDPFIWRDPVDGSYHMIVHNEEVDRVYSAWPGLHLYSTNGIVWHASKAEEGAFGTHIEWDDGSVDKFYRRERPEIHFNEAGLPLFLVTGVEYQADHPNDPNNHQYSFTVLQHINSKSE